VTGKEDDLNRRILLLPGEAMKGLHTECESCFSYFVSLVYTLLMCYVSRHVFWMPSGKPSEVGFQEATGKLWKEVR
jgi:hypothetical protein